MNNERVRQEISLENLAKRLTPEERLELGLPQEVNETESGEERIERLSLQAEIKADSLVTAQIETERDKEWKKIHGMKAEEVEDAANAWLKQAGFTDLIMEDELKPKRVKRRNFDE